KGPDRVAAVNWAAASVLATLAGVLVGPITGVNPATSALLVVPALAAAVVGDLSSFSITTATGLILGMAQSEITHIQSSHGWLSRVGVGDALPFVVIVAAVAARGRLGRRSDLAVRSRLPLAGLPRHIVRNAVIGLAAGGAAVAILQGDDRVGLISSMVAAVVCLS